ncbi:hypothetical protein D4R78_02265 [bacterium]|nr:MAG: hypothetical protein D4R78_02265 [bacterium]
MLKKNIRKFSEEDIKALEEKCKSVKQKIINPRNAEFHDKLKDLLNAKADSRDNFINWITGLTTGAIFLILNKVSPGMDDKLLQISIIGILFFTIISAFLFKVFLEVRYSCEELDVALLKNIWEGYDIKSRLEDLAKQGKEISEEEKQKFYKNLEDSVNYLDSDFLEKSKKPITIKSKLLVFFYGFTIFLFFVGITLMIIYFILIMFKPVG